MQTHPADRHYRDQVVRITDLAVTEDTIEDVTFENCQIVGPAVLVFMNTQMANSSVDGDFEAFIWPLDEQRERIIGAIGLVNCSIFGCKLSRVGLGVPTAQLEEVRAGFTA